MKYLYLLYHHDLSWNVFILILSLRFSAALSRTSEIIHQRWCYSNDRDFFTPLFFNTITNAIHNDRILTIPSCITTLRSSRYVHPLSSVESKQRLILLRGGSGSYSTTGNRIENGHHQPPYDSSKNNDQFIQQNPSYQESNPLSVLTLGDLEQSYATRRVEDDVTSLQRVQDHDSKHLQKPHYAKLRPIIARASTYGIPIQQHLHILYQQYPILTQIALACIVTFITWHVRIQSLYKIMSQYFVCHQSHMTLRNGKFLSLLLSAISHIDVWHLLYNLMALLSLGPSVQAVLESKLSTKGFVRPKYPDRSIFASIDTAMWLLVLGAALSGSIAYLLWNDLCGTGGSAGGCLGLSSVTMSMLSIYASAYPDRILQFRVGGSIPVRLPAHQILLLAFVGSIVGCLFPVIFKSKRNDGISHSGHLGGLIFGVVYYDIAIMNRRPFINSFFATLYSRFQRAVSKNSL